jgi:hypothetical protein
VAAAGSTASAGTRLGTGGRAALHHFLEGLREQFGGGFAGNAVGVRGVAHSGFQKLLVGWIGDPLRLQQGEQFFRRNLFAGFFAGFFQDGVFDDLLGDHLLQLQPVQLENGHHLDQAGGQDLLLRDPKLQ